MEIKKCYFRILSESSSIEGSKYKEMFNINFDNCFYKCSGYKGFGDCERFVTDEEFKLGSKNIKDYYKSRVQTKCF